MDKKPKTKKNISKYDVISFTFKSEKDLRDWIRFASNDDAFFIEPAFGATPGLPDTFFSFGELNSQVLFAELKCGEIINSCLKFSVTKEQKRTIPKMMKLGVAIVFIVAEKNSSRIWIASGNYAILNQKWVIDDPQNKVFDLILAKEYYRLEEVILKYTKKEAILG